MISLLLSKIKENCIGQRIKKVAYSEVNNPESDFYFRGFHAFDYGILITMENGYQWHISWKNDHFFGIEEGMYSYNQAFENTIKNWDATQEWESFLDQEIIDIKIQSEDPKRQIFSEGTISFVNGERITILIGEELNIDNTIPKPLKYQKNGEIYVFFDQHLLSKNKQSIAIKQNR